MATLNSLLAGGVKRVQHVSGSGTWVNTGLTDGANSMLDVPITAVDINKAYVVPLHTANPGGANGLYPIAYRLLNATTVRCLTYGGTTAHQLAGRYMFEVVESY